MHKSNEYTGEGEIVPPMAKWHEVPLTRWVGKGEGILCVSESSTLITSLDYFPFKIIFLKKGIFWRNKGIFVVFKFFHLLSIPRDVR